MIFYIIIFLLVFILSINIINYINEINYKKSVIQDLLSILSNNIKYIEDYARLQEIAQIKKSIELFAQSQIITKIAKSDFTSFFKYDYSNGRYVVIHFLLSMDKTGNVILDSVVKCLDELPITSNLLTIDILKNDDKNLYQISSEDIKTHNDYIYELLKLRNIKKLYYQNIFRDDVPLGFIFLSYLDGNYEMPDSDKKEILRILERVKLLI